MKAFVKLGMNGIAMLGGGMLVVVALSFAGTLGVFAALRMLGH